MIFLSINRFIFFLVAALGLWLAFWVYLADKKKKMNKYFFLMVILWIFGEMTPYFIFRNISASKEILVFLPKLTLASVFVFLAFFYFFFLHFLREKKKFPILNKIVPIMATMGAFLAIFTNLFQKRIETTEEGLGLDLILTAEGKIIWLGFIIFLILFIFIRFLINYFKSDLKERLRTQYIMIGFSFWVIISLIFTVYFALIQDTFRYTYFSNYSIIFLLSFTAYAIVKQELFGIKVVITAIFVGLITILLGLDALIFTSQIYLQLFKGLILVVFLYFGYLLIKSVTREIKQREKIEKLSKAKSEFISIASHQLRTPLTAIKGYISMILEGTYGETSPKVKKPMKKVYISNERLINLVNDLLSISRIESGKMEIEFEKVSIEGLISNIVDMFGIEAKKKKIFLKFKKPKEALPKVLIDKEKITDVISNIVNNCIKYTKKGGITIKVQKLLPRNKFGVKRKLSKLRITISDTGEGITKEELSKMFQSFSRGMAGTKLYTEGAGLGLYVAKKYVEMHHGKIWAESAGRNKGSTFYIELPMR